MTPTPENGVPWTSDDADDYSRSLSEFNNRQEDDALFTEAEENDIAAAISSVSRTNLGGTSVRKGNKPPIPSSNGPMYLGAHVNLVGQTSEIASMAYREQSIGRTLDIGHHYYNWLDTTWPGDLARDDVAHGRFPMESMQMTTLANINNGSNDAYLASQAQKCAAFGWPMFFRPGWEMNGNWYAWSGPSNSSSPAAYIRAWQRIWRIFQENGATNVAFVWCPNANSAPGGTTVTDSNNWRYYYPGDAYVDYVSTDVYNWGDNPNAGASWQNLRNTLNPFVADWQANFGGFGGASKPFMLAEVGCYPTPGNVPKWHTDAFAYLRSVGCKAVVWFDTNNSSNGQSSPYGWNVDNTTDGFTSWKEAASDPYWNGHGTGGALYREAVLARSPNAYWFSHNTGLTDLGSGAHNLTTAGSGTPNRPGPSLKPALGESITFNGSSYCDAGTLGTLGSSLSSGFSIAFMAKVGSTVAAASRPAAAILGQLNTGTTTGIGIFTDTNKALSATNGLTSFWYRNNAGSSRGCDIATNIYDGLWHHIVWVCDPTAVADTIYVDGAAMTLNSSSNATNAGASADFGFNLYLGARNNRGSVDNQLNGGLAEVAIFTSKLTSGQVSTLYASLTAV